MRHMHKPPHRCVLFPRSLQPHVQPLHSLLVLLTPVYHLYYCHTWHHLSHLQLPTSSLHLRRSFRPQLPQPLRQLSREPQLPLLLIATNHHYAHHLPRAVHIARVAATRRQLPRRFHISSMNQPPHPSVKLDKRTKRGGPDAQPDCSRARRRILEARDGG